VSKWRYPDDIKEDFASGDPERIRIGLAGLCEFSKDGDEVEMPVIDAALLLPFGDAPPDETVRDLVWLLMRYRYFVPARSRSDTLNQLVELAVRYGVSQVIYETSIELQCQPDPAAAARAAIDYIRWRGLAAPRELEAARKLVRYLLDAKLPVRRAVAEALANWPPTAASRTIVKAVLPQVEANQRRQLRRNVLWPSYLRYLVGRFGDKHS
jgi:hypothetical protein